MAAADMKTDAENISWLVASFADRVPDVLEAIVVSSDGLLLAASPGLDRATADQFSAISSGLTSLGRGASSTFGGGTVHEVVVQMEKGFLFVTRISESSNLAVLATRSCDVGLVAHEMSLLVERVGAVLSPALVAELQGAPR